VVRFLADASLHDGIVSGRRRREPTKQSTPLAEVIEDLVFVWAALAREFGGGNGRKLR
jgi:hypothetical protein